MSRGLLVIDKDGNLIEQLTDPNLLNGPWNLAVRDDGEHARVFVANALSGTVTRLDLQVAGGEGRKQTLVVENETQIASGYAASCSTALRDLQSQQVAAGYPPEAPRADTWSIPHRLTHIPDEPLFSSEVISSRVSWRTWARKSDSPA
jgi:hypothetical protein